MTTGIYKAIDGVLARRNLDRSDIISVNIGTTHFINAIIESDKSKLARVAVLRLCGPFCRQIAPFEEFPPALRAATQGYVGYLMGGLESESKSLETQYRLIERIS